MTHSLRAEFAIPTLRSLGINGSNKDAVYLCGNSLGLMPLATRTAVEKELDAWANLGVVGHEDRHDGSKGWIDAIEEANPLLAPLLGAKKNEVAVTGTLTANLNQLLQTFYRPTAKRFKLLCEAKAFPSDNYSFQSQVRLHGFDPKDAIILATPRPGEHTLRTEDILALIDENKDSLAVCILSGVQYYTGQFFEIEKITAAAKAVGAVVGWDLAHATGNVPLRLHDWGVDFAMGCTYKYLNAGAGNLGYLFVHESNFDARARPAGWWGVPLKERFNMGYEFSPDVGALGYCQSNPSWSGAPCLVTSLKQFEKVGGIDALAARSRELTGHLEAELKKLPGYGTSFTIITPSDPAQRGAQLTLLFVPGIMEKVFASMVAEGVIGDKRKPDALRLAPAPLYNTIEDVDAAVAALSRALEHAQ